MTFCINNHSMLSKNTIKLIRSLELKKNRRKTGLFVAEGPKVVCELINSYNPNLIIATKEWIYNHTVLLDKVTKQINQRCTVIEVTEEELSKASFLVHPQHVMALFHIKNTLLSDLSLLENKLSLALDGVQDPGNLGTIIRIADWYGIDNIICSYDTADVYNPKVVQATMGSIARTNVIYTDLAKLLDDISTSFPVYGTFLDGNNIYREELSPTGIIVMGNEGSGISSAIRDRVTKKILIPRFRSGECAESLNVAIATAITCAEFKRRFDNRL